MKINIIVPTLNELNNIENIALSLINILNESKYKNNFKICIVDDDSQDGTEQLLPNLKTKFGKNFDYIIRKNEKGLSSAIVYGINSFIGDIYIITDADIQYDLKVIPEMINIAVKNKKDIVIADRIKNINDTQWKKSYKYKLSRFGFNLVKFLTKKNLPNDILSGFFLIKKKFYNNIKSNLSIIGFKILLDIFLSSKQTVNYGEIYSEFKSREIGESKMDFKVLCDFIFMIFHKIIPINKSLSRFLIYLLVNIPSLIFLFITFFIFSNIFNNQIALIISFVLKFIFNLNFSRLLEWSFNRVNYFNYILKLNFRFFISLFFTLIFLVYFEMPNYNILNIIFIFIIHTIINYILVGKNWRLI